MKRYIDCDGVILDTEKGLFDEYDLLKKQNPALKKKIYLQQLDWEDWLMQARILQNAIYLLNNYDYKDVDILTKVHSLKEASAKIKYFRSKKVKNNIHIVPDTCSKTDIVIAKNSILVDDSERNLQEWDEREGYAFSFGACMSQYPKVDTLEEILDEEKLKMKLKRY